jgi:hypothetical protein
MVIVFVFGTDANVIDDANVMATRARPAAAVKIR